MISPKHILLTIDVEDWFQVENFKPYIPFSSWPERELRVERNVHQLLDLFDESEIRGHKLEVRTRNSETERWKVRRCEDGRRIGSDHFLPEINTDNKKSQRSSKSCLSKRSVDPAHRAPVQFFVTQSIAYLTGV